MKLKRLSVCIALAFSSNAFADEAIVIPEVVISAKKIQALPTLSGSTLTQGELISARTRSSDTAALLDGQAGVSINGAGGVSSLPAIHGMADDRVRIQVDGMDLISACANHMNSPLSYIDPSNVGHISVLAGITPVSLGGDSIGGTIQVDSAALAFAEAGQGSLLKGELGAFYRSNNQAVGGHVAATVAGESVSMRYTGSTVKAGNYRAGGDFKVAGLSVNSLTNIFVDANEVASSQFQSHNQQLAMGWRTNNQLLELSVGLQNIPYQGFANEYMDMLKNQSQQINLSYTGQFDWGKLKARAYNEHTQHYMNKLEARLSKTQVLGMPMDTDGKNTGVLFSGELALSERDTLRMGGEVQQYRLSDWWNSAPPSTMMSPNTFWNINNGQRDRLAVFSEWEARWSPEWESQLGLRSETVKMNTDTVQGYNTAGYGNPALATSVPGAFNAVDRQRTDQNLDLTAVARFTPNPEQTFEFGLAQKTRSPNLYERFAWSSANNMTVHMNNWFGDGNGYVGNLALKPEVARTLSTSLSVHEAAGDGFEVKFSPYYTLVENYIDGVRCPVSTLTGSGACTAANLTATTGFVNLQFVNQSAQLFGADISANYPINANSYGALSGKAVLNYVQGKNLTTGDNLYHIMPLNIRLGLVQQLDNWTNLAEVKLVSAKTNVSAVRNELTTAGYALLNLRSQYEWKQLRLDVGLDNVFNQLYFDPMGGSYIGQLPTSTYGVAVPGMGRSLSTSLTVKF